MKDDTERTVLATAIGHQLTERRIELGMSLRDIAAKANVSRMTVSRALKGDNSISVDNFMAIAHALGLSAWRVYKVAEDVALGEFEGMNS